MMNNFSIGNKTRLLFRNDPIEEISNLTKGKKVLFIYGGNSVHSNGCFKDVQEAVQKGNGQFIELGKVSRDLSSIENAVKFARDNQIEFLVGAGGAALMDATKAIAYGFYHDNIIDVAVSDEKHLPLILIPTYPSSGSEFDPTSVIKANNDFKFVELSTPNYALLVPKYSLTLDHEMTSYASLITFVQLATFVVTDTNPISYDQGISVIKNVLKAANDLQKNPNDLMARGIILYGASMSTSGWLGLGGIYEFPLDFYYIEAMVELVLNTTYRKTLTILFPRILKAMKKKYEKEIQNFLKAVFGFDGPIDESINKLIAVFAEFGIPMHFEEVLDETKFDKLENNSTFSKEEIIDIVKNSMK